VTFEPGKESFHKIHRPHQGLEVSHFKILGVLFDSRLIMRTAADSIAADASWRVTAILRVCRFSTGALMRLYKSKVLSVMEASVALSGTPARQPLSHSIASSLNSFVALASLRSRLFSTTTSEA